MSVLTHVFLNSSFPGDPITKQSLASKLNVNPGIVHKLVGVRNDHGCVWVFVEN